MNIQTFLWSDERIAHIARHHVEPEEEVCYGQPLILRGRTDGPNPVYYVPGQIDAGRYLFCVVIRFPDGNGYPVTARPMTEKEERRYREWSNR